MGTKMLQWTNPDIFNKLAFFRWKQGIVRDSGVLTRGEHGLPQIVSRERWGLSSQRGSKWRRKGWHWSLQQWYKVGEICYMLWQLQEQVKSSWNNTTCWWQTIHHNHLGTFWGVQFDGVRGEVRPSYKRSIPLVFILQRVAGFVWQIWPKVITVWSIRPVANCGSRISIAPLQGKKLNALPRSDCSPSDPKNWSSIGAGQMTLNLLLLMWEVNACWDRSVAAVSEAVNTLVP